MYAVVHASCTMANKELAWGFLTFLAAIDTYRYQECTVCY